jgi:hypothetical protein
MQESGAVEGCSEVIRRLADGKLAGWSGLPGDCSHQELSSVLSGGEEEGNGRLSELPVRFRMYRAAKQPELIQAWFDGHGRAFLLTFSNPELSGSHEDLLRDLGPPEAKLEPGIGLHADTHQWIYASRGLTLFVREHLNQIGRIAVYHPTTPSYYEEHLGGRDRPHYLPRDR